jgi:hypothetical protein
MFNGVFRHVRFFSFRLDGLRALRVLVAVAAVAVPLTWSGAALASKPGANGITYHGGPLMTGTVPVYFIYYGNWTGNSATSLLPSLISDLSGSSYQNINTTYSVTGQTISGSLSLAGQATDNYSQGSSVSDAQVQAIVARNCGTAATGNCDPNAVYFVFTSADVNALVGATSSTCFTHSHATIQGQDLKYAWVGDSDRNPAACEPQTTSPNGNPGADAMANWIAAALDETITDPDGNAWYDNKGRENAAKCTNKFDTTSTASNGSQYNFSGTHQWLIQENWVNASRGYCSMTYP